MALDGIRKQATVLSYMGVFLYLRLMFLVCISFMMMVKQKKGREPIDVSGVMH